MKRSAAIAVRVEPKVKKAVEAAAADDHRSVASFLEKLLVERLKDMGYLAPARSGAPKPPRPPKVSRRMSGRSGRDSPDS